MFHSDLLQRGGNVPEGHYEEDNMKATVVPNRNALFSSLLYGTALSIATTHDTKAEVVLGVHSGDHAIYPDCRPEFYRALEHAFALGNWESERISFTLPYLDADKTAILRDAEESISVLGLDFDEVFSRTITSYAPDGDGRSNGKPVRTLSGFWRSMPSDEKTLLNMLILGKTSSLQPLKLNEAILKNNTSNG